MTIIKHKEKFVITRESRIMHTPVYYVEGGLERIKYVASVPRWNSDIDKANQYGTIQDAELIIEALRN